MDFSLEMIGKTTKKYEREREREREREMERGNGKRGVSIESSKRWKGATRKENTTHLLTHQRHQGSLLPTKGCLYHKQQHTSLKKINSNTQHTHNMGGERQRERERESEGVFRELSYPIPTL